MTNDGQMSEGVLRPVHLTAVRVSPVRGEEAHRAKCP
jgi:hypothetical protein